MENILRYAVIWVVVLLVGCGQQKVSNTPESKIEAESYAQGLQDGMTGKPSHANHCSGQHENICQDAYLRGVQDGISSEIRP